MIARTWRGAVRAHDAESYLEYLKRTGFAAFASTPGNVAALGLRRRVCDRAEFLLISLWDTEEAVRRFAGEHPERAVFFPEDDRFLIERDDHVDHFDVVHLFGSGRTAPSEGDLPAGLTEGRAGIASRSSEKARTLGTRTPGHGIIRLP